METPAEAIREPGRRRRVRRLGFGVLCLAVGELSDPFRGGVPAVDDAARSDDDEEDDGEDGQVCRREEPFEHGLSPRPAMLRRGARG